VSFCAICTDDRGPFTRRPLGKDEALVDVCRDCDEEPAKIKHGPERGYEEQEAMSVREMHARIRGLYNELDPITPEERSRARHVTVRDRTPGWLIVRLSVRDGLGRARDIQTAIKTMKDRPYFAELHYLGASGGYFLFERPDPKVAADQRRSSENPLVALEKFRA
jgi:uncharacterized small protein (DUF1192 family)